MDTAATYIGNILGLVILVGIIIWVFLDAKNIRDDGGRSPGLVNTNPGAWAVGVFMLLIVVLPIYLVVRVRYKRLLTARRIALVYPSETVFASSAEKAGVWPPPPNYPSA